MKNLFIIFLLCISMAGMAQVEPYKQAIGNNQTILVINGSDSIRGSLIPRRFNDTASANAASYIKNHPLGMITANNNIWLRDSTAKLWQKVILDVAPPANTQSNIWYTTGNYFAVTPSGYGIGTNSTDNLPFKTNAITRVYIPSGGFAIVTDQEVNKIMTLNTNDQSWGIAEWPTIPSPGGNYGNIQITRNGLFTTPSLDSLGYTTAGGFSVLNTISGSVGANFNTSSSAAGDVIIKGQTDANLFWTDASANEVYIGTNTDAGAYKLQVGGDGYFGNGSGRATLKIGAATINQPDANAMYFFAGVGNAFIGTGTSTYALAIQSGNVRVGASTAPTMRLQIDAGRFGQAKGANVASAGDLTLGADGNLFNITGTTTINAITTTNWQSGSVIRLLFAASLTVSNNTAGGANTAKILLAGGVNFSATANDILTLVYDGTNWMETARSVN